MSRELALQFAPTAFVNGSVVALLLFAAVTNMTSAVQAPLYALVAATGVAVVLVPRPAHIWDKYINLSVRIATACAAWLSAQHWLLSEDAGTAIELVAGVWSAVVAFVIFANVQAAVERHESGGEG